MASRRIFKKDIDSLITELIMDCYLCIYEHPDKDLSGFETVINEAIQLRDDMINRINHVDIEGGNPRNVYRTIKNDFSSGVSELYQKLDKLTN